MNQRIDNRCIPRWLWPALFLGLGACVSSSRFKMLEDQVLVMSHVLQDLALTESEHGRVAERSFREIISHFECPSEDVRKLVSACALGTSQCEQADIQRAVGLMIGMSHRMAYFRPGWQASQLLPERIAMLQTLIKDHKRTVNTKLLVLVLPSRERDPKAYEHADILGRQYSEMLADFVRKQRTDGPPIPVIDPKIIGCEKGQELVRRYEALANDRPLPGEPTVKERRAVIWTFMVDC